MDTACLPSEESLDVWWNPPSSTSQQMLSRTNTHGQLTFSFLLYGIFDSLTFSLPHLLSTLGNPSLLPTSETSHFCNSTAVHPAGGTSDKSTEDLNEALLLFSWTSKDRRWEITRTWWRGQERRRTTFLKWLTCTNVPAICRLGWGPEGSKLCCPSPRSTGYN